MAQAGVQEPPEGQHLRRGAPLPNCKHRLLTPASIAGAAFPPTPLPTPTSPPAPRRLPRRQQRAGGPLGGLRRLPQPGGLRDGAQGARPRPGRHCGAAAQHQARRAGAVGQGRGGQVHVLSTARLLAGGAGAGGALAPHAVRAVRIAWAGAGWNGGRVDGGWPAGGRVLTRCKQRRCAAQCVACMAGSQWPLAATATLECPHSPALTHTRLLCKTKLNVAASLFPCALAGGPDGH